MKVPLPAAERSRAERKVPPTELADSTPSAAIPSPLASQRDRTREEKLQPDQQPQQPQQPPESDGLISRLLIAPIVFISFLLSLALVDRQNRDYRAQRAVPTGRLGRLWRLVSSPWYDVKEYQYPNETDASVGQAASSETRTWRGMHRKMARLQVVEAFELRGKVVAVMVVLVTVVLCGVLKASWALYGTFYHS